MLDIYQLSPKYRKSFCCFLGFILPKEKEEEPEQKKLYECPTDLDLVISLKELIQNTKS